MKEPTKKKTHKKDAEPVTFTKARILKNLLVASITFLFSFTASEGLGTLQSTMDKDVGVISFAVEYACGCIASLLLPKYLIKKFGSKLVLVASMFAYVPYLCSNFYPVFGFMIPTSIIVGFASSLIWNSLCTYLNDLAFLYAKLECRDLNLDSTQDEKKVSKNYLKNSPELYNCNKKDTYDIFTSQQSMISEKYVFSTGIFNPNKEVELTDFKCRSPVKPVLSKENANKSNLVKEELNNEHIIIENDKNQSNTKQSFDLISKRAECPKTDDSSNISIISIDSLAKVPKKKETFETKLMPYLNSVPEANQEYCSEEGFKSTMFDGQNDSLAEVFRPSDRTIKVLETTTSRFFVLFGFIYQMCHILSNVTSYLIFQNYAEKSEYIRNASCVCGSQFCSFESACVRKSTQLPGSETRYILTTVYVLISFFSALIALLALDRLEQQRCKVTFSFDMAIMTLKLLKNKDQLLLLPVSLYCGMSQAFLIGDFTKDFIACAWGVEHVSLVMISTGCAISLCSGLYALFEKHIGRYSFFFAATALNLIVNITMLNWTPDSTKPTMMFVVAGILGAVIGLMWCHVRAFIGLIFKEEEEAAFGNYQLWHALGCAIVFAYNNYLCTSFKIYILLTVSTMGAIGYFFAERNYAIRKKEK